MAYEKHLIALAAVVLAATGCTAEQPAPADAGSASPVGSTTGDGDATRMIDQPNVSGLDVAPDSERVDLEMPTFTDPTSIDNPLFPVGRGDSNVLLGKVDGKKFRTEVTVLPETRFIEWNGERVETVVSQYTAFLDGRIHEVALDLYAQDDEGAVWYFGEDVFNFEAGVVADTEGTWFAGKDGPAAMIMPADPQVGDVYRPENIPGNVFEEVTVKATDRTVAGPQGNVADSLLVSELHMDATLEDKTFAPGYGEFYTSGGGDVEALAQGLPTDALPAAAPAAIDRLLTATTRLNDAASASSEGTAGPAARTIDAARRVLSGIDVPPLLATELSREMKELRAADTTTLRAQESVDIARLALDLRLRHAAREEVDLSRLELWVRQLLIDIGQGDPAAVNGDLVSLDLVRDRVAHAYASMAMTGVDVALGRLRVAAVETDLRAATDAAASARRLIAGLEPV